MRGDPGARRALSNPLVVRAGKTGAWWGDLHGQSGETVGVNTIDEYFAFGRDLAFLDVMSHQANDFQINNAFWAYLQVSLNHVWEQEAEPLPLEILVSLRGHSAGSPVSFSPDGEWLAYWSGDTQTLQKIPISGGAPVTIVYPGGVLGAGQPSHDAMMEGLAAGEVTEDLLSDWIQANSAPR